MGSFGEEIDKDNPVRFVDALLSLVSIISLLVYKSPI